MYPSISKDGRYVAYVTYLTDYPTWRGDVVVWDRTTGSTTEVTHGNKGSFNPSISGATVASSRSRPMLTTWCLTTTICELMCPSGTDPRGSARRITDGDGDSFIYYGNDGGVAISDSGRFIVFGSQASDLVPR